MADQPRTSVHHGDCLDVMAGMEPDSVDAVVTDPPYGIDFMGKAWDRYGAEEFAMWCRQWAMEALRVVKPGGHLIAFGATRTHHRLMQGVEDAGWEVRDCGVWLYRSGFPKSLDVSKAIDRAAGAEREVTGTMPDRWTGKGSVMNFATDRPQSRIPITGPPETPAAQEWEGWGTALKPAIEPFVLARKPLAGTVAANVTKHGTGALNIDGCRTPMEESDRYAYHNGPGGNTYTVNGTPDGTRYQAVSAHEAGRWPANVVTLDDLPEWRHFRVADVPKASSAEKPWDGIEDGDELHPTVKPLALMRHLVRLVTPPGGVVLDPFAGTGTTGEAAIIEGFRPILIEREDAYLPLIERRLSKPIEPVLFGGHMGGTKRGRPHGPRSTHTVPNAKEADRG